MDPAVLVRRSARTRKNTSNRVQALAATRDLPLFVRSSVYPLVDPRPTSRARRVVHKSIIQKKTMLRRVCASAHSDQPDPKNLATSP